MASSVPQELRLATPPVRNVEPKDSFVYEPGFASVFKDLVSEAISSWGKDAGVYMNIQHTSYEQSSILMYQWLREAML